MNITPILHTLDEIEIRLGLRLKLGLQRLLQMYKDFEMEIPAPWLQRLLCAAWAFVMLFCAPNIEGAQRFVEMLHGQHAEQIVMCEEPLRIEANSLHDKMFWDLSYYMMHSIVSKFPFLQDAMKQVRLKASLALAVCSEEKKMQEQQSADAAAEIAYLKGVNDQLRDENNYLRQTFKTLAERNHIENHYTGDIERQYNAAGDTNNNPSNNPNNNNKLS